MSSLSPHYSRSVHVVVTLKAFAAYKLNVEEYPDAFNPYDSLGEAYAEAGQLDLAIENYEKSVELNPENTNGVAVLERLRAERSRQE